MKKITRLTETDLHNIVENVTSNMMNNGQSQQPQQQQGQNNQDVATMLWQLAEYVTKQFNQINRNMEHLKEQNYQLINGLRNLSGRR